MPTLQQWNTHRAKIVAADDADVELMNFSPSGAARPSTVIGPHAIIWLRGNAVTPPVAVTPGRREPFPELPIRQQHGVGIVAAARHRQFEREDVLGLNPGGTS
jgi:hypothetical protein